MEEKKGDAVEGDGGNISAGRGGGGVKSWSRARVGIFLAEIGLGIYAKSFHRACVDGSVLIDIINMDDQHPLKEKLPVRVLHFRKLARSVKMLVAKEKTKKTKGKEGNMENGILSEERNKRKEEQSGEECNDKNGQVTRPQGRQGSEKCGMWKSDDGGVINDAPPSRASPLLIAPNPALLDTPADKTTSVAMVQKKSTPSVAKALLSGSVISSPPSSPSASSFSFHGVREEEQKLMGFGEHRDRTYAYVRDYCVGYPEWCVRMVQEGNTKGQANICYGMKRFVSWLKWLEGNND
mmetsp:Transcript_3464/g.4717  ORF Transcript_3464/g.4717 Transcript_3464/m.4717 type:complete len:294 (+) Transcript_3464:3-884(+)